MAGIWLDEVAFVHQVSMPHHQQATVLAGLLNVVEGLIQLARIDAGSLPDLDRIGQCSPAALRIRRRKIFFPG